MANIDGTNAAPLLEGFKGVGGSPRWSPDGRVIVFDGQNEEGQLAVQTVSAEGIKAEFKDGVLTVTLPAREEAKPRQVQINVQ